LTVCTVLLAVAGASSWLMSSALHASYSQAAYDKVSADAAENKVMFDSQLAKAELDAGAAWF
jgi:hypothetical protein